MPAENRGSNTVIEGAVREPEEGTVLRAALDQAWDYLPPKRRTPANRGALAVTIARLAACGERDPGHLWVRALQAILPEAPHEAL
jgi:hypothetical protein